MAITITGQPHTISPNGNLNTWMFTSDNPNIIYCVLTMTKAQSTDIIAKKKVFPKPLTNVLSVDVSNVLKNLAESILNNSNEVITLSYLPEYNVKIEEYILDPATGNITAGDTTNEYSNYFFESEENVIDFFGYDSNKYNIQPYRGPQDTTPKAKYLTNQQQVKNITTQQKEFLKIFDLNRQGQKLKVSLYDSDNDLLLDVLIPIQRQGSENVINLNVSPLAILSHQLIKNNDEVNITHTYKVVVLDGSNNEVSESRIYTMQESCQLRERNIVYKNVLGGWDSIIINNSIETLTTAKTYINRPISRNNTYSQDGKFFGNKDVISNNNTYSYTASSNYLDDYESNLAKEIITSNKVYVGVDDFMVEITVDNKTYKVLQQHLNGYKRNRLDLQYTAPFSIQKLQSVINANDINLNNNPDSALYLAVNSGDFVIDNWLNSVTLKY
ncbi:MULTISPECIES: hypothetical protein [Sphingobacterium]|uniref:hypothetical protein n=1 Tax=Sphingobacterium TaxID=28453 RepID=UPI00257E8C48|nr:MULTISPECIES: hypothetical protein [Sphingobacterium]